jgi:hypothetical protein
MLDKSSYRLVAFQPVWLPFNDDARTHCATVLQELGLNDLAATGEKHRLLVASFLYATNHMRRKQPNPASKGDDAKPVYFGVSRGARYWTPYPLIGKDIGITFIDRLIELNWINKVEGSGDRGFSQDEKTRKWTANPTMTMYHVDDSCITHQTSQAERFIQIGKPYSKVNQVETRGARQARNDNNSPKPTLDQKSCKQKFRGDYTKANKRIEALNEFWRQHPLVLENGNAAACATRVFHDSRIDAGGRFYGLWTGLESSLRLMSTIDGEQVCQIDIRGSQPTLLSSLLGIRLKGVSDHGTWHDVYTQITGLWDKGFTVDDLIRASEDASLPDPYVRSRTIAKRLVMEVIGIGNVNKKTPSSKLVEETGVTQDEWVFFKERLVTAIPALKKLEPRYDALGHVMGYINGAGFLSYHESEMILKTIETLHSQGITAYPVHDCLIVKVSDAAKGVQVLKDTVCQYCYDLSGPKVSVPLTVETSRSRLSEKDMGLENDYLRGQYL